MSQPIMFYSRFDAGKFVALVLWTGLGGLLVAAIGTSATGAPMSGLSIAIAALTLFVGALVATYSARYMRSDPRRFRFFSSLGGLVLSVLMFVLANNAFFFAAGWLASGFLLASLIGHSEGWSEACAAARRSQHTFLIGDFAVVAGLGLLCWSTGTWRLDSAIMAISAMPVPLVGTIALLLLAGAAARCALPPFSGWLMSSMTAPTPVSALMHAGLVNAGGFLLLRFSPVLEAVAVVRYSAIVLGLFAAIWGIGIMAVRPDIKRSLAGSTVSQMGFMIMSCGLGAYAAALWHIVAHGLFKAWLFLNAGSAIGMQADRRPTLEPRVVVTVAAATLIVGGVLTFGGIAGAELVPLLLAIATGLATLGAIVLADVNVGSRLALAGGLSALALVHVLGFEAASAALPVASATPLPPAAAILLLAVFLGGWVCQSILVASRTPLPAPLYVRLLNAGALRPALSGDRP